MSYISSNTRISRLEIAGTDYTSSFIEMAVSDSSANRNGCVLTSGVITLGDSIADGPSSDYFRERFKRGDTVDVFVKFPEGGSVIHPRGALYVVSTSYDVESEILSVEVACKLSLMALTENKDPSRISELIGLVPIDLDPVQSTFSNCCAGISSAGRYVYQDSARNLQSREFWAGDSTAGTESGVWLSVLGVTTNSIAPLSAGDAVPDQISLSYQVPDAGENTDNKGRIDTTQTDSYYFLQYPVTTYQRQNLDATAENPNGTLENVTAVSSTPPPTPSGSGSCGNSPPPPATSTEPVSCNEGYALVQTPIYLPAYRRETRVTSYDGPSAQVSYIVSDVFGPRVEANTQYFADSFAFCRQTYATGCNFDGGCSYDGMDEIKLNNTRQLNYYGAANELVRTVLDTYETVLSAAQPSDWRSGNVGGNIQDFDASYLTNSSLYRSSRVDSEYYQEGNVNVQKVTTYTSMAARGVGVSGGQNIDAVTGGIQTVSIRKSSTIATLDVQPDIINSPTTSTVQQSSLIPLFTGRYTTPPTAAGPYILDEAMPQPVLLSTASAIESLVASYTNYLIRFTKGEAFGLQIAEGLRDEVLSNYYPGLPFRYYDPKKGVLIAMRMDATTWGVSNEEAAFVTNALWNGVSNGAVTIPDNILGNSSPDMSADSNGIEPGFGGGSSDPANPTPPPVVIPPSVDDETSVDSGSFAWYVDINLSFKADPLVASPDGVQPPPPSAQDVSAQWTTVMYVDGLVVESGDLLAAGPGGSIPIEYNGSLVTDDGVFVRNMFD